MLLIIIHSFFTAVKFTAVKKEVAVKFYNRTSEIVELQKIKGMAYKDHSKLTVLVERRRIGKTLLILNALKDESLIYLFFVFVFDISRAIIGR